MVRSRVKELKELLVNSFGDDIEIVKEQYKMLAPPGEHFGSIMLSLDVTIEKDNKRQVVNLVAKLLPINQMLRKLFNVEETFKMEINAYLDTIPALEAFQDEYHIPPSQKLDIFPKCFGARVNLDENHNNIDEDAAIILENLITQGYIVEDRLKGFDLQQTQLLLKDLAKYHAVTIALKLLKPKVFEEKVYPSIIVKIVPRFVPQSFLDCIIEHSDEEDLKPYQERLKKLLEKSLDEGPANPFFATAIHRDYWVNNILILKDSNGNPIKTRMVDLQTLTLDSIARDILFLLFLSVQNEVLDHHYEDLLKFYHSVFIKSLSPFGVDLDLFSWEAFMKEMDDIAPREAFHIFQMIKPVFTEKNKITRSLEDFDEKEWEKKDLLSNAYKDKLKYTILNFAKRNWF